MAGRWNLAASILKNGSCGWRLYWRVCHRKKCKQWIYVTEKVQRYAGTAIRRWDDESGTTKKDAGWTGYRHLKNRLHRWRNGCRWHNRNCRFGFPTQPWHEERRGG